MSDTLAGNKLNTQTSPYLLQHAHNPVHWYAWEEAALQHARRENKPILLSIGYSACHWCHVMAHESFEDEATAGIMNSHFVNIKVDREERPDLDKIYQSAHQLLTGRAGGWPLTVFLHPRDLVPFFAGTYFPAGSRYGMPAFQDVLQRVARFFREHAEDIDAQNRSLMKAMEKLQDIPAADPNLVLDNKVLTAFVEELSAGFDEIHGGFGRAPKFPHPGNIELLLQCFTAGPGNGEPGLRARHMALFSLEKMAEGGIFDQLGGGFCRYSVDDQWQIPHFEKMLYDNGPLLGLYAQAWKCSGRPLFKNIALATANWVIRDMQAPAGGYYSSLDADSEGAEGRFYVWTATEIQSLLGAQAYEICAARFGLKRAANFEGEWHLHVTDTLEDLAQQFSLSVDSVETILDVARTTLLERRNTRVWPARDDKILTSWNALMIRGMTLAAGIFERDDLFYSAERALDFLQRRMWHEDSLLATCRDEHAHLDAYLDDYAFLLDALMEMQAYRWSGKRLHFALQLAESLLARFYDHERGGFFFTSHDHEKLIQRRKDFMDDALPAGNGIAALALCRLGHLVGESRYLDAAEQTLRSAWPSVKRVPSAHAALLLALQESREPSLQVIIRGEAAEIRQWQMRVRAQSNLQTRVFALPDSAEELPGSLAQRSAGDSTTAYVCRGFQCLAPIREFDELIRCLNDTTRMT